MNRWHSIPEPDPGPLDPFGEPRVINCRCITLPPPELGSHLVTPSPRVDRDVKDVSHEWLARASIKAYTIDAGPPKAKRKKR